MANPFDRFDEQTAAAPSQQAPAFNPFDAFDKAPHTIPGSKPGESGPLVMDVHPTPKTSGILVDPHDPDAAQRAWDTLTGSAQPSTAEAGFRGVRQGIGLNFADEARGLAEASGLPSWLPGAQIVGAARLGMEHLAPGGVMGHSATDRYNQTVSQERASDSLASEAHPLAYTAGELGGGLAGGVMLPMAAPFTAAKEAGALARAGVSAGNLAATGGIYGGIAGLGGGEGDLGSQIGSTLKGAATGAVLGPAIGGLLGGGRAVGGYIGDHIAATRNPTRVADEVVRRALERDNINPADLPQVLRDAGAIGPQFRVDAGAEGQVHSTTSGSPRAEFATPQITPQHNVSTPQRTTGQPLTAADVAGVHTQDLAGQSARLPGPGRQQTREFLDNRQIGTETQPGQGARIADQVTEQIGGKGGTIATADALIAKRSAEAKPAYRRAFETALDYSSQAGQDLLGLIERIPNAAKAAANQIIKMSDEGGHQLVWKENPDINGNFQLAAVPNARQWHYIKMGIDHLIDTHTDAVTGKTDTMGRAATMLKQEMVNALNELNPAYKIANQKFAGQSELISALRAGGDAFKPSMTPEALAKAIKDLTPGEAELFRLGAANALKEKLGNAADGVNKARLAFGNPSIRAKIAALAPTPQARQAFVKALENEKAMFETRARATGNSATAERLAGAEDLGHSITEGVHLAANIAHGNVKQIIIQAARHLSKVNPELRGKVLDEVRKVVLNPDPKAVHEFVARMHTRQINEGAKRSVIGAVLNALPQAPLPAITN